MSPEKSCRPVPPQQEKQKEEEEEGGKNSKKKNQISVLEEQNLPERVLNKGRRLCVDVMPVSLIEYETVIKRRSRSGRKVNAASAQTIKPIVEKER